MYVSVFLPYEFTLLQNSARIIITAVNVLLPYEFTLLQNLKKVFKVATSACITGYSITFYYITSLFPEKHIECHACANLFNYPAILHFFRPSKRHLKLLPAQNARNYTTPKYYQRLFNFIIRFTTLWIYTTSKPQKKTEAATSACITGHSIASYHIASLLSKTYWLPYLCKIIQLPCDFAPLQMLK